MSIDEVPIDVYTKIVLENGELKAELKENNDLLAQIGVLPYLRMKCQLYLATWSVDWSEPISFQDDEVPNELYGQTQEKFGELWSKWLNVLLNSLAPAVANIKTKITATYPDMTDRDIAKYLALLQCFLMNAADGSTETLSSSVLKSSDAIIDAFKKRRINDPVLLFVTEVFEDVTIGR